MTRLLLLSLLLALSACAGKPRTVDDGSMIQIQPLPEEPGAASDGKPLPRAASLPSYRSQPESRARSAESYSGPAVLSLLRQARSALNGGRNDQASAAMERALRIEPKNPFVWQMLAAVHLRGQRAEQAEATAEKSISLAQGNPYVAVESWRLIAEARQMAGDASGAEAARKKADELKNSLTD